MKFALHILSNFNTWMIVLLVLLGSLSGYASRQYGRKLTRLETPIGLAAILICVFGVIFKGSQLFVDYLYFIFFEKAVAGIYGHMRRNKYLGPDENLLDIRKISLGDSESEIDFSLPAGSVTKHYYSSEDVDKDFSKNNGYFLASKKCFSNNYKFYCGRGEVGASFQLTLMLHKADRFESLEKVENLNAAASWHFLTRYVFPEHISQCPKNPDDIDDSSFDESSIKNWMARRFEGRDFITYSVYESKMNDFFTHYIHVAFNDSIMLSIEVRVHICDTSIDHVAHEFLRKLDTSWCLDGKGPGANVGQDEIKTLPGILPPQITKFNVEMPTWFGYKEALRNHSNDVLEWMVFEQSFGFTDWYACQLAMVCNEYNALVDKYADDVFNQCLVKAKTYSETGATVINIHCKTSEKTS